MNGITAVQTGSGWDVDDIPSPSSATVGTVLTADQFILGDTGSTARAQNTAVLKAAFDKGGIVWLPGEGADICCNPFTTTGTPRVIGQGSGDPYGPDGIGATIPDPIADPAGFKLKREQFAGAGNSIIRFVHTSGGPGITFQRPGVHLEHFKIVNTEIHTGTDQILVQVGVDGTVGNRADGFSCFKMVFKGGYHQLSIKSALGLMVTNCGFVDPDGGYSLLLENMANFDECDPAIVGNTFNTFSQDALGAVFFGSGGGVKFVGNKINRQPGAQNARRYYDGFLIRPSSNQGTSVLLCCDNSIENVENVGVFVDCTTQGAYNNVKVANNEFLIAPYASISVQGRAGAPLYNVSISGNISELCGPIRVGYVTGGNIGVNHHRKPFVGYNQGCFVATGVLTQFQYTPQSYSEEQNAGDTVIFDNGAIYSSKYVSRFDQVQNYSRSVDFTGIANGTWVNYYFVDVNQFDILTVTATVQGSASGIGAAAAEFTRRITSDANSPLRFQVGTDTGIQKVSGTVSAPAPTSTADSVAMPDIAMRWNTVGTRSVLQLQVPATSTASGDHFTGSLRFSVIGNPRAVGRAGN